MTEAKTNDRLFPSQLWRERRGHHIKLLQNPWYSGIAVLQNTISELTVEFWRNRHAQTLHLPVTTGSISSPMGLGSDSYPVEIELGGAKTYLADSMQFMLELGCRITNRDCYYIMPSFRGEACDETHLSQFFHSEAEIEGGLADVMSTVEEYVVALSAGLLERNADLINSLGGRLDHVERLVTGPSFVRLTFDDVAEAVGPDGVMDHDGWRSLTRKGEQQLLRSAGEFVWVTHWDHLSVPFYQAFADEDGATALNGDLLFGPGEVVGAGERHLSADQVRKALALHHVDEEPYRWYVEIREEKEVRTAGFGMGIERYLMWLLSHNEIRDMQLLPRAHGEDIFP